MTACLVLLATLFGTLPPDCQMRVHDRPVLREEPCTSQGDEGGSARRGLFSNVILRGLRGQYRRIRAEVSGGTAVPEPDRLAFGLDGVRIWSSAYESLPRLEREHDSPPATGPPPEPLTPDSSSRSAGSIQRTPFERPRVSRAGPFPPILREPP